MRKLSDIFKRKSFEEDYDKFNLPTTSLKESEGTDLTEIADKELIVNSKDELLIRKGNEIKRVSGSSVKGDKGDRGASITGAPGIDGDSAYVYIAYASDDIGTGFTMTFDSALDYIAILSTDTEIVSPVVGDFAGLWKKYRGEGVPTGGTTGQALVKASNTNYDTTWATIAAALELTEVSFMSLLLKEYTPLSNLSTIVTLTAV